MNEMEIINKIEKLNFALKKFYNSRINEYKISFLLF